MARRKISQSEFDAILNCVAFFPAGASLEEISKNLKIALPHRTLKRHVMLLVNKGSLIGEGKTRGRRYRLPHVEVAAVHKSAVIPLSSSAQEIQTKIHRPIQARAPVGYNREFLDLYRPNVTVYLPEHVRLRLLELGKTDGERPAGTYVRKIFNRLLIDLSWNSSRLEGNTYSLLETERLLKLSEIVKDKDFKEAKMILNHKEAIEFLVESADHIGINRHTILNLHALLSNELLSDLESCGRLRSIPVGIAKTTYLPLSVPQLIAECFQQILDTANAILNPFEQAFFLMVHLPYLQPFEDVNKRVSRLAANIPLIRNNLCPLSFVDVPQDLYVDGIVGVYELNRIELLREVFVWAYERSCLRYSVTRKELGQPDPFRLRYRALITEIVAGIVRGCMNKTAAIATIRQYAQNSVPTEEQPRFIEEVERDVMSLHEGNIARHRLLPSDYERWRKVWE